MSSSSTNSPAGSRRRSSSQRSPVIESNAPPPPGPAISRSGSRHRSPAGSQNLRTAASGGPLYTGPSSQPYNNQQPPVGAGISPRPAYGPLPGHLPPGNSPGPPLSSSGHIIQLPHGPVSAAGHHPSQLSQPPHGQGALHGGPGPASNAQKKRLIVACDGKYTTCARKPSGLLRLYLCSRLQLQSVCEGKMKDFKSMRLGGIRNLQAPVFYECISLRQADRQSGTWKSADSANLSGSAIVPSNVVHITRAIKSMSRDGISQVVFYKAGVGTDGGLISRLIGGATAKGLEDDILQGYYWLCQNWLPSDEIFLTGFSRGAFTARSIAGMVDGLGLLTREGIKHVNIIFKDFENRNNPNYRSEQPDLPFRRKPSTSDPRYLDKYAQLLAKSGFSRPNIPIKAVAVFDTVGSLGIPRIPLLERLGLQPRGTKEYEFYDTSLGDRVEHAFQALALDEQRAAFSPSVWEKKEGNGTDLRQVWFPGVHTNVGGGYPDSNLSNISLAWMMAQLAPLLDLDDKYILEMAENNAQYYSAMNEQPRPWSLGRLYNSLLGVWVFGGHSPRNPGMYTRVDPDGVTTDTPLRQTNEYVHASARSRFVLDGLGYRDTGFYRPRGLEAYRLRLTGSQAGQGANVAMWESRRKDRRNGRKVLSEAPLFEIEKQLLRLSPHVEHVVLRPQQAETELSSGHRPQRHSRRRDRDSLLPLEDEKVG